MITKNIHKENNLLMIRIARQIKIYFSKKKLKNRYSNLSNVLFLNYESLHQIIFHIDCQQKEDLKFQT